MKYDKSHYTAIGKEIQKRISKMVDEEMESGKELDHSKIIANSNVIVMDVIKEFKEKYGNKISTQHQP